MAIRHYVYAAGIAASLALLAACGDEVTEVTNVSEKASLDQVKKFKELPKCDEDAEGSLVYVKDSAKVFSCNGKDWVSLNGKDGSDGKDGKNGSNGDDGSGCTVKQNKAKTGLDIVCDGKKVGSVENGSDGKDGSDGDDGASCTAKQNKKKTGFDIICGGKTVGTVLNGDDGKVGDGCSLEDDGSGHVTVTCGGESVTLVKALCGTGTYDPELQFCVSNQVYPKCNNTSQDLEGKLNGDGSYDVNRYFCDKTDLLLNLCGGQTYDLTTQFCYQNIAPVDRCNHVSEGLDPDNFKNGEYLTTTYFCYEDTLWKNCGGLEGYNGQPYDPKTQFCSTIGTVEDFCGKKKEPYDVTTLMCNEKGKLVSAIECCKPSGVGENWCNADEHNYDVRTHFCDTRDGQTYKFTKIAKENEDGEVVYSATWMAENLNYNLTTAADFVSECRKTDGSCDKTYGRYYSWPTAKGSCPDDWDVPTQAEWKALFEAYGNDVGAFLNESINESMNTSGFSVIPGGYLNSDDEGDDKVYEVTDPESAFFWSKTGISSAQGKSAYFGKVGPNDVDATKGMSDVENINLLNVRCIKRK